MHSSTLHYLLWVKREMMENGGRKRERKESGVDRAFHPGPLFFPPPNLGEKRRENAHDRKYKIVPVFHLSTFNNKDFIEIYSYSLHILILLTKNMHGRKHTYFLSSQPNKALGRCLFFKGNPCYCYHAFILKKGKCFMAAT